MAASAPAAIVPIKTASMNLRSVTILALFYGGYVLVMVLYPFEFSWSGSQTVSDSFSGFFKASHARDFILNIALFIPFGVLFYSVFAATKGKGSAILLAIGVGGMVSLFMELLQILTYRHSSGLDVLSNTLGTGAGALATALLPLRAANMVFRYWRRVEKSGVVLSMAVVFATLPLVFALVQLKAPFGLWNSRFSFQIGNETTLDRPWLGKIHEVALYSRALRPDEVAKRFNQGLGSSTIPHAGHGLVALYSFSDGKGHIVQDKSGFEPPLDLIISPRSHVRWLANSNGIEVMRPAILKGREAGAKLTNALNATHQLSVEVWVTPRDAVQTGPARIVSLSHGTGARNFTLGQDGSSLDFRLRTVVSGMNGTAPSLTIADKVVASEKSHVVATYKDGVQMLYVNGKQQSPVLDLANDSIIGFGARKTPFTRSAYSFFYFFPVSFFFAVFFSAQRKGFFDTLLISAGTGTGLLVITEMFQALAFDKPADFSLMGYGAMISTLGAMGGIAYSTGQTIRFLRSYK